MQFSLGLYLGFKDTTVALISFFTRVTADGQNRVTADGENRIIPSF